MKRDLIARKAKRDEDKRRKAEEERKRQEQEDLLSQQREVGQEIPRNYRARSL